MDGQVDVNLRGRASACAAARCVVFPGYGIFLSQALPGSRQRAREAGSTNRHYLKKVLERDPQNADALLSLALAYGSHAKLDVTRQICEMIERNDPLQPRLPIMKIVMYWMDGRFHLALEVLEGSEAAGISDIPKRMLYAMMFIYTHRPEDASRAVETLEKDIPGSYFARCMRLFLNAYNGKKASVDKIMTPDFAAATKQDYQYSTDQNRLTGNPTQAASNASTKVRANYCLGSHSTEN